MSRSRTRLGIAFALLVVGEVLLYRLWPLIDDNDAPPTVENQLALTAAFLFLALPHILAGLARRGRPWLFKVAGGTGIVLTLVSVLGFSLIFVTIPLVMIPSIVYLVRHTSPAEPSVATGPLFAMVVVLCVGAAGAFFLTEDPRCSIVIRSAGRLVHTAPALCDPNNSGVLGRDVVAWSGSSDTVALHESLLSLALTGTALAICTRVRSRETQAPGVPIGAPPT